METVIINKKTAQKSQAIRQGRKKAQGIMQKSILAGTMGNQEQKLEKSRI